MIMIPAAAPAVPRNCRLPILSSGAIMDIPPQFAEGIVPPCSVYCPWVDLLRSIAAKDFAALRGG
jgi:hypothetical protein